ncbi:dihydrofolate reductase [Virgibacillus sp. MSJ-26]|uniref:dihydrofolate reductase n=1 Tax=Virgibacillus sp. MSJ-26 TaxID=2841522 RepID=UPI001C11FAE0|nr:dihydrofolate reductase [Virgibacillus sp. MSJ-26]MBU5466638.1 dihydrofolate reductase [Virgibacillus sp. MSJ-26]
MISLLVAMDQNRVIGLNNDMPWHLPKDLKFFKQKTVGHTIVMGRKTFNSIGRVLPNRKHVILTRNKNVTFPEGVEVIYDISGIKDLDNNHPNDELFVIGGGKVFEQVLPIADRMYVTLIDETFEGDVYFPNFSEEEWTLTSKVAGEKDEKNPYDYFFLQYDRS